MDLKGGPLPPMREVWEKVTEAQELYYKNRFGEAEALMNNAEHPFYLTFKANLIAQRAALTFERDQIKDAVEKIELAQLALEQFRRSEGMLQSAWNWITGRNFVDFTDDELNCEVAYAEMTLIKSMMDFIEGESFLNFVKGAVGISKSYQLYKEIYVYFANTKRSIDPTLVSSVYFGYGTFVLYLSMIPQKILTMLEFVGIHGSMDEGLQILIEGEASGGITSDMCALVLLHFNMMICNYVRIPIDEELTDMLLKKYTSRYPHSVIFSLFAGKRHMTLQDPVTAGRIYEEALDRNCGEWPFMKFTLHLELTWCSLAQGKWEDAVHHAKIQYEESNRSRTFFAYLQMICHGKWRPSDVEEAVRLANLVPTHQLTIAGKHLHIEKYSIRKARSYLGNDNYLFCPVYECLYFFGLTSCVDRTRRSLMIREIQTAMATIETQGPDYPGYVVDDKCLGRLLLADLYRLDGNVTAAKAELETLLQSEDSLTVDHMISPFAHFELGYILAEEGKRNLARAHFETACNYSTKVKSFTLEDTLLMKVTTHINRLERQVVVLST